MTLTLTDRKLTDDGIDQVHAIVSDWDVARMLGSWPWPPDRAYTRKRMKETLPDGALVCCAFEGETLCGTGGLMPGGFEFEGEDVPFWGLMLPRAHWRKGIGRAIATYLFDRHFGRTDQPVYAQVWGDNSASQALHTRLGFVEVGRTTSLNKARREDTLDITYRLTRDVWEART